MSLARALIRQDQRREDSSRQGKVVSIQNGPPRTITVNIGGSNYAGIRVADHVRPVVDEGVWITDIGNGRWLATSTNSGIAMLGISSGTSAPTSPGVGQMWLDTTSGKVRLKVCVSTGPDKWKIVSGDMPRWDLRNKATWTNDGTNPSEPVWGTVDIDTDNFRLNATDKFITIPTGLGGIYACSYSVTQNGDAAAYQRAAWMDVNVATGTAPAAGTGRRYGGMNVTPDATTGACNLTGSHPGILLMAGDVLRVKTFQNSAATKTWGVAADREDLHHFSGIMISHLP